MLAQKKHLFFRLAHCLVLAAFVVNSILPSCAYGQSVLNLPAVGAMVGISPAYVPIAIKGLKVFPDNPFRFDFILDTGNSKLEGEKLQAESSLLIKYFLAALTVPDDDQWVNLSPYEKERVIPQEFGVTEMGRDLLAQDYLLKQLTASLIYPEHELGKKFWERVHKKAYEKYGDVDIPVNTFNKVWIMPEHAKVYESGDVAFIVESHLKVMLEEDYLALKDNGLRMTDNESKLSSPRPLEVPGTRVNELSSPNALVPSNQGFPVGHRDPDQPSPIKLHNPKSDIRNTDTNALGSQIIREIVLPEIEKEVNEGRNFSKLRQIYHSMIMAAWFKRKLQNSMLGKIYVGANKVSGVDVEDKEIKQKIYDQYLAAFKQGVYNYIREEYDEKTQETTPRKYFSGGVVAGKAVTSSTVFETKTSAQLAAAVSRSSVGNLITASSVLQPLTNEGVDNSQRTEDEIKASSAIIENKFTPEEEKKFRSILGEHFKEREADLIELTKMLGSTEYLFRAEELFGKSFGEYVPTLLLLAKAYGREPAHFFYHGLPLISYYIESAADLENVGFAIIQIRNVTDMAWINYFHYNLPKLIALFGEHFKEYLPTLVELAETAGPEHAGTVFTAGLPLVKNSIHNKEDLKEIGGNLIKIAKLSKNPDMLFHAPLAQMRNTFGNRLVEYLPTLVELTKAAKGDVYQLFKVGLPGVKNSIRSKEDLKEVGEALIRLYEIQERHGTTSLFETSLPKLEKEFGERFKEYLPTLIELSEGTELGVYWLVQGGLQVVSKLIHSKEDLKEVGSAMLRIVGKPSQKSFESFKHAFMRAERVFGTRYSEYLPTLFELAKTSSIRQIDPLFSSGLRACEMLIKNPEDLKRVGSLLLKIGNEFNWDRIYGLLDDGILREVERRGADVNVHLDFYIVLLNQYPRLGLQILEGLFLAIEKGEIDVSLNDQEKSRILRFIHITRGFNRNLYKLFLEHGEGGMEEVLALGQKALKDDLTEKDLVGFKKKYDRNGYDAGNLILAGVQSAIPSSGASFVQNREVAGLFKRMRAAGDLRGHVPEALRKLGSFGGKDIERMDWILREGESSDPDGKISAILSALHYPDTRKSKEQTEEDVAHDKGKLIEELEIYLQDKTDNNRQKVLEAFYAYARHNDFLKEKIDKLQLDYEGLSLLEQFFYDKDSLGILLAEVIEKDIDPDFLKVRGARAISNISGFIDAVRPVLDISDEGKRAQALRSFLSKYDVSQLQQADLPQDIRTPIDEIIGNQETNYQLSVNIVVEQLLAAPLKLIVQEKSKYEARVSKEPIKLRFRAVKGIAYGLWGLLAGVCTADDVKLWKNKEFYLLAMIDEQSQQAVGFIHMVKQGGILRKKVLVVPGIEPSVEFMGQVKVKEIYPLIVEALRKVAQEEGYAAIYLPMEENILSNRSGINDMVRKSGYQVIDIPTVRWNTSPRPFPFKNVYVLPLVEPAATQASSSPLVEQQTASAPAIDSAPIEKNNVGGIDMNSKALDLETTGEGIKFDMPFDPAQLQNIQIDGFSPVILQIVPTNLPLLLGVKKTGKEMQVSSLRGNSSSNSW